MGKRERYKAGHGRVHTTLGEAVLDATCGKIESLLKKECDLMLRRDFDQRAIVEAMFDPAKIALLKQAYGVVLCAGDSASVHVAEYCSFVVDFDSLGMATPRNDDSWVPNTPIGQFADQAMGIYYKWMTVRHVVMWLDEHATAGAMRYYLPGIINLLPENSVVPADNTKRHVTPKGIGALLPMIRDAASTIATAQLFPETAPFVSGSERLSFAIKEHHRESMHCLGYLLRV